MNEPYVSQVGRGIFSIWCYCRSTSGGKKRQHYASVISTRSEVNVDMWLRCRSVAQNRG